MSLRFVIAAASAVILCIALAVLGYTMGDAIVQWRMTRLGIQQVIFTSPSEPAAILGRFALTFAFPPLIAGVAVVLHRVRAGRDPSLRKLVAYFASALAGLAVAIVLPTLMMPSFESDLQPMVSASNLGPGDQERNLEIVLALALWAIAWFRTTTLSTPPL